jgi:Flp pilus assembly pilin Flp
MSTTPLASLRSRISSEDGQTLSEYSMILALIVIFSLVALGALGVAIATNFANITAAL